MQSDAICILGVDYGEKRTGVAMAHRNKSKQWSKWRFSPLATISTSSRTELLHRLALLAREWRPTLIAIGALPTANDGCDRRVTLMARRLARQLNSQLSIPTKLVDERLTSACASSTEHYSGEFKEINPSSLTGRVSDLDQLAAIEILRTYVSSTTIP